MSTTANYMIVILLLGAVSFAEKFLTSPRDQKLGIQDGNRRLTRRPPIGDSSKVIVPS